MSDESRAAHAKRVAEEIAEWSKIDPAEYDQVAATMATDLEGLKAQEARIHDEVGVATGTVLRFRQWRQNTARDAAAAAGRAKAQTLTVLPWGGGAPVVVSVALIEPGRKITHRGRNSWTNDREITIDKVFEVSRVSDGAVLGFVEYKMLTRETRSEGRRYVNSRWESPGWTSRSGTRYGGSYSFEASSKKDAIERLVREASR